MRDGKFRRTQAGFRTDVGNWGWSLTDSSPGRDIERLIEPESFNDKTQIELQKELQGKGPLFGGRLRSQLKSQIQRQVTLGFLLEQLPECDNSVSICDHFRDALGLHKPVIHYQIGEYTRAGMASAYDLASDFFAKIEAADVTDHEAALGTVLEFKGKTFKFIGAGHIMGTHRMGRCREHSVVDHNQQSWEHPNLYVVGCGSMPTVGTSNPTLTGVALTIKSAEHIFRGLDLGSR